MIETCKLLFPPRISSRPRVIFQLLHVSFGRDMLRWYSFLILNFLFILYINHSSPFLPSCPERIRPPMGSRLSLAYQVESGPSPSSTISRLSKVSHHREWLQNTNSCTRDQVCSHCQGSHKQTKSHSCHPHSEGPCRRSSRQSRVYQFPLTRVNCLYGFHDLGTHPCSYNPSSLSSTGLQVRDPLHLLPLVIGWRFHDDS